MARDKRVNKQLLVEGLILVRYWDYQIQQELKTCADEIESLVRERRIISAMPAAACSGEALPGTYRSVHLL